MGIKGLLKLLQDQAPGSLKSYPFESLFGRKIAVDASMCLYQFLIAVRTGADDQNLTNQDGEVTSHLQGLFYRTLRMLDEGIKPLYVFDGKPPILKGGELEKRKERRADAEEGLQEAKEGGDQEDINKFQRRLVRVTREQNEEAKKLLRLMGVPVVEAPGEAEAMCAELAKKGVVYATATEDMDALTFGTPRLVRNATAAASRKLDIIEVDLASVLSELQLTMDEFIDLCILMGCDYTTTIRGIGPNKALEMIQKHKSIEEGLKHLNTEKYTFNPEEFLYREAAALFKNPDVTDATDMKVTWTSPDEDGLLQFLCEEKGFSRERVLGGIERLKKSKGKAQQQRLDGFFTILPKSKEALDKKRKADAKKAPPAKKPKTGKK